MGLFSGIKNLFSKKSMDTAIVGSYPNSWVEADDSTGEVVNSWTALKQAAVLQCVTILSNGISQIPFRLMKKGHKLADDDPLYYVLKEKPNRWQSSFDFWELIGFHLALQGYIIVWVVRVRGIIKELIPFPPHKFIVSVKYVNGWMEREFTLIKDDGSTVTVPESEIWELRWRDWDIRIGIPQLDLIRQVVSIAIAGDKLSGSSLRNGCRLEGMLTSKQVISPDQKKQIREDWQAIYGGPGNTHKTAVLGFDMEYKPLNQTNTEAQFIEQKKFQIEEICRAFNVNPMLVFYFDNAASYNNMEQMMVQHVVYTMAPWYRMIEESAYVNLLTEDQRRKDGLYFAFNDAALMRADAKSRAEFYQKLFNIGSITPNEIRAYEDMPPKEGGDELYIQGAVVPLKEAGIWQDSGKSKDNTDNNQNGDNSDTLLDDNEDEANE